MLVSDRVRFVGEPIAAVVASTRAQAEDAIETIEVDYDELDPVVDVYQALAPGAPLIQFSYGMQAPVVPLPGHAVTRTAMVWANLPPARVWVYRKT